MQTFPGRGHRYDLAVVGAGIAGSEVAMAAARAGRDVLLVTTSLDTVYMLAHARARLEPPPGTLLSELIGPAPDGGAQVERWELHRRAKYALEAQSGLHLLQSNVVGLLLDGKRVTGVRTWEGVDRLANQTALCVGSFLHARLEQGRLQEAAGRLGEMAYDELFDDLEGMGLTFEPLTLELSDGGEGLPYRVSCNKLAAEEVDGFEVKGLENLHAAGVCAHGTLSYEAAATQGRELGLRLAATDTAD